VKKIGTKINIFKSTQNSDVFLRFFTETNTILAQSKVIRVLKNNVYQNRAVSALVFQAAVISQSIKVTDKSQILQPCHIVN
jgi:hypothetical protein